MATPAESLDGAKLDGGWTVLRRVQRSDEATGSQFSCGYIVQSVEGREAYLKALDYVKAFTGPVDLSQALFQTSQLFLFERELCKRCRDKKLSRVVRVLTDGTYQVDASDPVSTVQYLIFELADSDVRKKLDDLDRLDTAWALRALHHIATAISQLHGVSIAHQDLKPSNVLVFPDESSKVADLGRCVVRDASGPFDRERIVGDRGYAPPELLYGYCDPDWSRRRLGCDAYLLGSMTVFLFTRLSMTSLIKSELREEHWYKNWGGSYEDALPYVRDAFGRAVERFAVDVPTDLRDDLSQVVRQLCDPDPKHRGHPREGLSGRSQFAMRQYVSKFNELALKVELGLIRG